MQLKKAINKAPNGTLQVSSSHGKTIFLHNIPQKNKRGKKKYIRKNRIDFVKELAQKDYNIKLLGKVEEEMKAIKDCKELLSSSLDDVFDSLSDVRKTLVEPFYESDDEYAKRWSHEAYESNPGFPEALSYTTLRGEKVRSKSEKNIADSLARYDIPYKYENKLVLSALGVIYPDFTILDKRSRKEVYWEHFGCMDDPEYASKALSKIEGFARSHLEFGKDYLYTMENGAIPLDQPVIDQLIKDRFLKDDR